MAKRYSGIRESIPERYTDLMQNSVEVEENFKKKCLKRAERSFAQGLQCQQINSVAAMMTIEESVMILHSPRGCSGCASTASVSYRVSQEQRGVKHIKNARILCSNLDKSNIVFGGEKKLRETAKLAVEHYQPKIVFIFTSCASGIIGEDIDLIASDLSEEYDILFVPIHCEGFKSRICASGYDAALISINKYLLAGERPEKKENLINLFVPTTISYADEKEMKRLLQLIGVEGNCVPFFSSLDKLKKITAATASTSICKVFADEFMKELYQDYDIPYSHTVMPIGIRNTDKWYRGIAKVLGKEKEVEEIIAAEHERIMPLVEKIKQKLEGKRVFVCGGTGRSFAAAALINDFGMELVGLETPTYDSDAQEDLEFLNQVNKEFIVDVAFMQPFEQANLLQKLKPDAFLGMPDWAAKLGIPTSYLLDESKHTFGYNGLVYLGDKIMNELSNPGFNKKLGEHRRLPYKENWYEENALKYIIGGESNGKYCG